MISKIKNSVQKVGLWAKYNPPSALSASHWDSFYEEFKRKAPIRYWFSRVLSSKIRLIKMSVNSRVGQVRYRTTDRYHVVRTDLAPGYRELDTRMLHASFTLLKDFVEVEMANMSRWTCGGVSEDTPKWAHMFPNLYWMFKSPRSPSMGLAYLKEHVAMNQPDEKLTTALELYIWWTETRPARQLPQMPTYDHQGLGTLAVLSDKFDKNAPDFMAYRAAHDSIQKVESQWEEEDTEMLVKLAQIRNRLWT